VIAIVPRARISAETIADTINHLIEPISYKTMVFFFALFSIFMLVTNIGLRFSTQKPMQHYPQPYYTSAPAMALTPSNYLLDTTPHTPVQPCNVESPYKPYTH